MAPAAWIPPLTGRVPIRLCPPREGRRRWHFTCKARQTRVPPETGGPRAKPGVSSNLRERAEKGPKPVPPPTGCWVLEHLHVTTCPVGCVTHGSAWQVARGYLSSTQSTCTPKPADICSGGGCSEDSPSNKAGGGGAGKGVQRACQVGRPRN